MQYNISVSRGCTLLKFYCCCFTTASYHQQIFLLVWPASDYFLSFKVMTHIRSNYKIQINKQLPLDSKLEKSIIKTHIMWKCYSKCKSLCFATSSLIKQVCTGRLILKPRFPSFSSLAEPTFTYYTFSALSGACCQHFHDFKMKEF